MSLAPGTRLGAYEIVALIGAGGMGEVYRATDRRLNRDVAIKILPDSFAADPERIARFQREAHVLASLNHSNIAHIYGIEDAEDVRALILELVDGPTLADLVAKGPVAVDEALRIAGQIAEALAAAHEHGVVHRDLKPANIKLTHDGTVKVLDFGLAKPGVDQSYSNNSLSPTITSPMMTMGAVLLGTAAYMSPEQAKGRAADKRSDVWGFGCVLYELLTGRRAFDGDDLTETIAAIVKVDPDWNALPADLPPAIRTLLRRCLEKDRRRRIADIAAAVFALEEHASLAAESGPPKSVRSSRWRVAAYAACAVLTAGLLAAAAVWSAMAPPIRPIARFMIAPTGAAAVTAITLDRELTITPNATHIVYVGNNGTQLFIRALDQLESVAITGLGSPRSPFVSPDGQWIGFFDGIGDKLRRVAITGGPAQILSTFTGQRAGATWGEDGTIVFATTDGTSGLWRVSAAEGTPVVLTKPNAERGEGDHLWPEFLPGGQAVLFTITAANGGASAAQIAVLDLKTGTYKILVSGGSHAHYVSSGHLVYGVEDTLRAIVFDLGRMEVTGIPVPVVANVVMTEPGAVNFDVARNGTLVYVPATNVAAPPPARTLTWVDRRGRESSINAPPRAYTYVQLSPDSTRAALEIRDRQNDIWTWSLAGETLTRVTADAGFDSNPVWLPDGRRIVFSSQRSGNRRLYLQAADGTGTAEALGPIAAAQFASTVSPDGAHVVFQTPGAGGFSDIRTLNLETRVSQPLVETQFIERNAEISLDGRWIVYEANDSGTFQIYVRPYPDVNSSRSQVTNLGGSQPLWGAGGEELFYRAPNGSVMGIRVDNATTWKASAPAQIFDGKYFNGIGLVNGRTYDVSPDGQRFLMIKPEASEPSNPLTAATEVPGRRTEEGIVVVQNWLEELKRLVPAK